METNGHKKEKPMSHKRKRHEWPVPFTRPVQLALLAWRTVLTAAEIVGRIWL